MEFEGTVTGLVIVPRSKPGIEGGEGCGGSVLNLRHMPKRDIWPGVDEGGRYIHYVFWACEIPWAKLKLVG